MRIHLYMAEKQLKQKFFYEKLEVSRAHFGKIKIGFFRCTPKMAKKIELLTNGKVTYDDMMKEHQIYLSNKLEKLREKNDKV